MHPALSLARKKLDDARKEFDQFLLIEETVIPDIEKIGSAASGAAVNSLRATGIEGVYTGIEGILKEVLNVVDGGVYGNGGNWHAQLLAQASQANDAKGRDPIINSETYEELNHLRAFRHIERNLYRHSLRSAEVIENLDRIRNVFPSFESELAAFIEDCELDDRPAMGVRPG